MQMRALIAWMQNQKKVKLQSNEIMILYFILNTQQRYRQMSESEVSECYSPEGDREQDEIQGDQVYKRRVEKLTDRSIQGRWTEQENFRYILYMDYYDKIFVSKEKRKSQRIFKSLSEFLQTRTPRQCRSHFQKIMNKFKKLKRVRQYYQEELGVEHYQIRLQELEEQIKRSRLRNEQKHQVSKPMIAKVAQAVQTDPANLSLADLSSVDLLRLMNLLGEYQRMQFPFHNWPQSQFRPFANKL